MPEKIMEHLKPDYGIAGEGERSFPALLECLEEPRIHDISAVPNLHYFRDGRLAVNEGYQHGFLELDKLARPDFAHSDPRYYEFSGTNNVQAKRGCPMKCTYCTYPLIEGRQIRTKDISRAADEIERAASVSGVEHLFIVDSVFNLPLDYCKRLCRELIGRNFRTPWTSYVNPSAWDEELAVLMFEAGGSSLECGSDSGSDETLLKLKKGFTTAQIRRLSQSCREAGIKDCHSFILGTPGDSMEQVETTLDFIAELDPFSAVLMLWVDDEDALNPEIEGERKTFKERIKKKLEKLKASHPRWVIPELKVNFNEKMFKFVRRRGIKGPLWTRLNTLDPMRLMS